MTTTSLPVGGPSLMDVLRARKQSKALPDRARRRQIREAAGASISEVAAACHVSHFAVYCWEKLDGKIEPSDANRPVYKRVLEEMEALSREFTREQPQE